MRRRVHAPSVVVLLVCLALTVVVASIARSVRDDTERRLLQERTDAAATVLTAAVGGVRAPLEGAASVAEVTDGDPDAFQAAMQRAIESGQFAGASLVDATSATELATVGAAPVLSFDGGDRARRVADQVLGAADFAVVDILDLPGRRLGFGSTAAAGPGLDPRFVVYAESALPAERFGAPRPVGAFEQLEYALFLSDAAVAEDLAAGPAADDLTSSDARLLYSSLAALPVDGLDAVSTVPLGDAALTLATNTSTVLGGELMHRMPWLLLSGGVLFAAVAAIVTEWLIRRRLDAERLAGDVAQLYAEQHARSTTLQRSLVPRRLASPDGVEVAARYWPAAPGDEVGGDFYDLFALGEGRWGVTMGDVCGKGIDAAALTALTRHTIRAAARHLEAPDAVLRWTHEAIAADGSDTYVTACFGFLSASTDGWTIDLALGGHPPPIVLRAGGAIEPVGRPGTVLGLVEPRFHPVRHELGAGDTLLLYTDGLTDAPGDAGLGDQDVREALAGAASATADEVADRLEAAVRARRPDGSGDDVALLVLRLGSADDGGDLLDAVPAGVTARDRDVRASGADAAVEAGAGVTP
jgi:serine phosphatase RsbU (regulator of sigma subunit)